MAESIQKLTPNRDLQCFFFHPSAIAAFSNTSENGFTLSGSWRQQFDWAVVEWNRDNVYDHPAFRYLPDGDLSGLTLTFDEERTNCIPLDSSLFPTVDWPTLRIWAGDNGAESIYFVKIIDHATPVEGSYACAYADFTLSGTIVAGDYVGLAFLTEHYTYQLLGSDTLESALQAITDSVNAFSALLKATRTGTTIRLYFTEGTSIGASTAGANGNRFGVYSYASGTGSQTWNADSAVFANGTSPSKWRVTFDFSILHDRTGAVVPTNKIRKMRWTYAADFQIGEYARSEFEVKVTNWTVSGSNRGYVVAGPSSRRIEDDDTAVAYSTGWIMDTGNYSNGSIRYTNIPGASVTCQYTSTSMHLAYVGVRCLGMGSPVQISIDGGAPISVSLALSGEDVLLRHPLGSLLSGTHTIVMTHTGSLGQKFYFDFLELAVPVADLPMFPSEPTITLATDWDTDHSLALAPERTAWMIDSLGFRGRQNHYVGALWFYELTPKNHVYASATITFSGTADPSEYVTIVFGRGGSDTLVQKQIHVGDTPTTLATAFRVELNRGYTGIRANSSGATLTIYSRSMGEDGNLFDISVTSTGAGLSFALSDDSLSGGEDGYWITDVLATPRINRAARDWSRSFFAELVARGIPATAAFSTELQHGDTDVSAGIAQRGPGGDAFSLPTPALQTNFSPTSLAFWKQVYADQALVMQEAGMTPYLQFGEEQWWYFPHNGFPVGHDGRHDFSGMPFYDAYTTSEFASRYGRPLPIFTANTSNPVDYPDEVEFLASLIGEFTSAVMAYVRTTIPATVFEVLYPTDVNQTSFNQAINFPRSAWSPTTLQCLKTESFGFTFGRDLQKAENTTIAYGFDLGFTESQRSHLVGIGDVTTPWLKEARIPQGRRFDSVVLFALDQMCLVGYQLPLQESSRKAISSGTD